MRTISDYLKAWKAPDGIDEPLVTLFDISITDAITLRLVRGDPSGSGSITYAGNVYTAAAIQREDTVETLEGNLPQTRISISNIDGIAGGYIEQYELEGRKVTITTVPINDLNPADATTESFLIQDQAYNRTSATVTLGYGNLFRRRMPWRRFQRQRCQWDWENRFKWANGCGYPSDHFNPDSSQDFKVGGTDTEKKRRFGWYSINATKVLRFEADGAEVPDMLFIESISTDIAWGGPSRDGPFAYKILDGDFDVYTEVELFDTRPGCLCGILCQEAAAGLDSWVLFGRGADPSDLLVTRLAAALDGVQTPDSDNVQTENQFIRMRRVGNVFTFFYGLTVDPFDPTTGWIQLAQKTLALDASVRLGLCMSAPAPSSARVAVGFRYFRFLAGGVPDCLRTLEDCESRHGNTHRIMAFPGIPRR